MNLIHIQTLNVWVRLYRVLKDREVLDAKTDELMKAYLRKLVKAAVKEVV